MPLSPLVTLGLRAAYCKTLFSKCLKSLLPFLVVSCDYVVGARQADGLCADARGGRKCARIDQAVARRTAGGKGGKR